MIHYIVIDVGDAVHGARYLDERGLLRAIN